MFKKPLIFVVTTIIGLACPIMGREDVVIKWNLNTTKFTIDAHFISHEQNKIIAPPVSPCRMRLRDHRNTFAASG
jgi:hypothetical protein